MQKKIKVLVVDDSLIFREVIAKGLSSDPNIEVVGKAENAFDALEKLVKYKPDVMTCDIEMPKMSGIEFIQQLFPRYPMPIIVVSSVSEAVFEAMKAGAVEFVVKPNVQSVDTVKEFLYDLISKIKIISMSNVLVNRPRKMNPDQHKEIRIKSDQLIGIGASTGGTEAITFILKNLPRNCPGIVIVQHIPPVFSKMFADRINAQTEFQCKEAENGDVVEKGKVIIAPGNQHIRIKRLGDHYKIEVFKAERVNGHCPSVDVLFESIAKEAGDKAIGVILTGMGYDGAKGLLSMRRKGAHTIGQDESSSVVYGMPKVAFNIGAVEKQSHLQNVSNIIVSMLQE